MLNCDKKFRLWPDTAKKTRRLIRAYYFCSSTSWGFPDNVTNTFCAASAVLLIFQQVVWLFWLFIFSPDTKCQGELLGECCVRQRCVLNGTLQTCLTLRPSSMTIVPYANSLNLDETPSNLASHPDPSCLTLRHFHHATLSDIKALGFIWWAKG